MVIRDELKDYLSYQKYLIGKNESWIREPKGEEFVFSKVPLGTVENGDTLITKGGRVIQSPKLDGYHADIVSEAWKDEFLYQVASQMPYDLSVLLSKDLEWIDECQGSPMLRALCVVKENQTVRLKQNLLGKGLRILDIVVQRGAHLRHDIYMDNGEYDYINVYVESQATYEQVYAITQSNRRAVRVLLMEEGACCVMQGCMTANQVNKEYVRIEHIAPKTNSQHLVNTLCQHRIDVTSSIVVHKTANQTSSKQAIQHLLLSDNAACYSKPAMDIAVDDVECEHGVISHMIDEHLLFYLLCRGLDYQAAKSLYIDGYIDSAYEGYQDVLGEMKERALRVLA